MKQKLLLGTALACLLAPAAGADEKSTIRMEPIEVVGKTKDDASSLTVPGNSEAAENIKQTPGGVGLVTETAIETKFSQSYEDSLSMVPGVTAKKRFAEEVRLTIRGSGLSRGYHLRGLRLLQDGVPFNQADGAGDFQELDPKATQRIEVYKGGNALQHGGTTLGGSVNTVTKTGRSNPGAEMSLEGGSYNTYRLNLQGGMVSTDADVFASHTTTYSSGFRNHDDQRSQKFNGNVGLRLTDQLETRFYLSLNDLDQELPGSVSRGTALNNPTDAAMFAASTHWKRDIKSVRFSNKTTYAFGDDEQIDFGGYVKVKDLFHPITPFAGIIDQESTEYGLFTQISGSTDLGGHQSRYRFGITGQFGETDANMFANVSGVKGAQTGDADQTARDFVVYGENSFYVVPKVAVVTGLQLTHAYRKSDDLLSPAETDSKTYTAVNPKLGVLYEPQKDLQFFANVSRSEEAPTFSELTQSGTVGFTPVDSQKAWTVEVGSRGQYGIVNWDVALYRAWIKDEMLQYTTGAGIPAATFNADDTIHQGVELGFDLNLASDLITDGDELTWRNSYTFSDFYFVDDDQFGDNRIAGQPRHYYQSEVRYQMGEKWFFAPNIELASGADVDFANTLQGPGYMLLNLNAGYAFNDRISLYLDAKNLLDRDYISTFSTIVNGAGNTNVYYPGEGRRAFVGVNVKF